MTTTTVRGTVPEFELCDRMHRSLRESGLGVQEIADILGVKRGAVGTWINGHVRPKRSTLIAWAQTTGVDLCWLETGEGLTGGGDALPESTPRGNRTPNPLISEKLLVTVWLTPAPFALVGGSLPWRRTDLELAA